jgi:hypothetical protein
LEKDGEEAPLSGKRWDFDGMRDEVPLFVWRNEAGLNVNLVRRWDASWLSSYNVLSHYARGDAIAYI